MTVTPESLAQSVSALAKAVYIVDIPMTIRIVPYNGKQAPLIPKLLPYATPATTINHVIASPFAETKLLSELVANHRKVLVIVGLATEMAVLQGGWPAIFPAPLGRKRSKRWYLRTKCGA